MEPIIVTAASIRFSLSTLARRHASIHPVILTPAKKDILAFNKDVLVEVGAYLDKLQAKGLIEVNSSHVSMDEVLDSRSRNVIERVLRQQIARSSSDCARSIETKLKNEVILEIESVLRSAAALSIEPFALISGSHKDYYEALQIKHLEVGEFIQNSLAEEPEYTEAKSLDKKSFFYSGCVWPFFCLGGPIIVVVLLLSFLGWLLHPFIDKINMKVLPLISPSENAWRFSILISSAGLILYWIRSRHRFWYGVAECMFGVGVSYLAIPGEAEPVTKWLTFFGALYVIVRGLDNVGKSIKSETFKKVWEYVFGKEYK